MSKRKKRERKKLGDVLSKGNWIKKKYSHGQACCLVGALKRSEGVGRYKQLIEQKANLLHVINTIVIHPYGKNYFNVESFNDASETTWEKVEEVIQYYDAHYGNVQQTS